MNDLGEIKHMEEMNWKPASQYWCEQCNIKRKKLVEAAEETERLREALQGVYACHGSNPSDAMADVPEIDYIKYTLMTARRIAKEALK